jgi:hypothetical protein
MPYEEHPHYETPSDDTLLWRYMDFVKFMDILSGRYLCLTRLDLMDDPREGRLTEGEYRRLAERPDGLADLAETPNIFYVSCWQENDVESMAMWDLYGGKTGSIAVRMSVGAVKALLRDYQPPAHIGRVKYYDCDKEWS